MKVTTCFSCAFDPVNMRKLACGKGNEPVRDQLPFLRNPGVLPSGVNSSILISRSFPLVMLMSNLTPPATDMQEPLMSQGKSMK